MRYSLNNSSGRDWHNYYAAGSVDSISRDAYTPGIKNSPATYIDPASLIGPIVTVAKATGRANGVSGRNRHLCDRGLARVARCPGGCTSP